DPDDEVSNVEHRVVDRQLDDGLLPRPLLPPVLEVVILDPPEGADAARWGGLNRGAGVVRRECDRVAVALDNLRRVSDEDIVLGSAVHLAAEEPEQSFLRCPEEDAVVQRNAPLLDGHFDEDLLQARELQRLLIADCCRSVRRMANLNRIRSWHTLNLLPLLA